MFCLFVSWLAAKLTSEDKNWRSNTILQIDGARYQTCRESVNHMKMLGFKIVISAPYSFAAGPIEYAFGLFKQVNLNPDRIKTGKR